MKTVLLVNHREKQCGVFQYGDILGNALLRYGKEVKWEYERILTIEQYWKTLARIQPNAVIFNYHPATLSLSYGVVDVTKVPTFGIVHENSWFWTDPFLKHFDYLISPDITNEVKGTFNMNRTIPDYDSQMDGVPKDLTIGSFGFAFGGKGYELVIDKVQEEFNEACIRLHIPYARFGDEFGANAKYTADTCRERVIKPNIELQVTHDFLSRKKLIHWLELNTLNCFFYDSYPGRGISSVIDFALAARRPIAITDSNMFRHLKTWQSIRIEETSLKQIIRNGTTPLQNFYNWTEENTTREYERIMKEVLA